MMSCLLPQPLDRKMIWVKSRNLGCLVTWFCYQLIAKPGNKTAQVPWLDPYNKYHGLSSSDIFSVLPNFYVDGKKFSGYSHLLLMYFLPFQDMTICAACAPPGGGRNPVTPRFLRHFSMLCLPPPSEHSLKQMFTVSHSHIILYGIIVCQVLV